MQSSLEVTIIDDEWPNLRIVCQRRSTSGELQLTKQTVLYDQAAVQFETQLTNHVRVMVADVINAHKQQANQQKR